MTLSEVMPDCAGISSTSSFRLCTYLFSQGHVSPKSTSSAVSVGEGKKNASAVHCTPRQSIETEQNDRPELKKIMQHHLTLAQEGIGWGYRAKRS